MTVQPHFPLPRKVQVTRLDLKTIEQHHKQVKKLLSIIEEKNELAALYR